MKADSLCFLLVPLLFCEKTFSQDLNALHFNNGDGNVLLATASIPRWEVLPNFVWLALVFFGLSGLINLWRHRLSKGQAVSAFLGWESKLTDKFASLPALMERIAVIRQCSGLYTGNTASLTDDAVKSIDQIFLQSTGANHLIRKAHSNIYPRDWMARCGNLLFGNGYQRAIRMLQDRSIGFDNQSELNELLYTDMGAMSCGELIGPAENYSSFRISLDELDTCFDSEIERIKATIHRLEQGIHGLPAALEASGESLEQISQRLSYLSRESQRDGFFPMTNVQNRLLPSAEALLDESVRIGSMDPVSAFESATRLAQRQISDAWLILDWVTNLRKKSLAGIAANIACLEKADLNPDWVRAEFLEHSNTLETISNHAVLWPIDEHLTAFEEHIAQTQIRINDATGISKRISSTTIPSIDALERRIASRKKEFSKANGIPADELLDEGVLNPSLRVDRARLALQLISSALGRGHIDAANENLLEINYFIDEASALLQVADKVNRDGDITWATIATHHEELTGSFPEFSETLTRFTQIYHPHALTLQGRFGEDFCSQTIVPFDSDDVSRHLRRAESLLEESQCSLRNGQLLTTGHQLEQATEQTERAGQEIETFNLHAESIEIAEKSNNEIHANCSWRHRTLLSRIEDRRTGKPTIQRYRQISSRLEKVEGSIKAKTNRHPFAIARELEAVKHEMAALDSRIEQDWQWYECASKSIKSAARTLRLHREFLNESGHRHFSRSESEQLLSDVNKQKQQLTDWQVFLEEDHFEWAKAFEGGANLENDSALSFAEVNGERNVCYEAIRAIEAAAENIALLKNWESPLQVEVNREAGDRLFEHARLSLANGNYQKAFSNAEAARQHADSTLSQSIALEKRAKAKGEAVKRDEANEATKLAHHNNPALANSTKSITRSGLSLLEFRNRSTKKRFKSHRPKMSSASNGSGIPSTELLTKPGISVATSDNPHHTPAGMLH